jgi:hypothetical protein
MNRDELRLLLQSNNVRPDAFDLDGRYCEECLRLEKAIDGWVVHYSERGLRTGERHFNTEDEACRYMADHLLRDPTIRLPK